VKIGDFGLAKRIDVDTALHTHAYTRYYAAPEVCISRSDPNDENQIDEHGGYTNAVDIWAIGIITHEILTKRVPFHNDILLIHYVEGRAEFPMNALNRTPHVTLAAVNFIKQLLSPNPTDRPTADECLNNPWLHIDDGMDALGADDGRDTFYPAYDSDRSV